MRAEVLLSFLLLAAVAASRPAPYWQAAGAVNGRRTAAEQTGSALPTASQNVPGPETPFSLTPKTAAALALSLVVSCLDRSGAEDGADCCPTPAHLLCPPLMPPHLHHPSPHLHCTPLPAR